MNKIITKDSTFDAVILAAGNFPQSEPALTLLQTATTLIACDSALKEIVDYNSHSAADRQLRPTAVVGDGDSLTSELKEQYSTLWHHVEEQDYNDLTKATRFAVDNYRSKTIAYIGATGKREDHTIGNIALMMYYTDQLGISPCMITDYGWFVAARGATDFESFDGQQVSVFNGGCRHLSSKGLKWDIYPFTSLWQGTLNEATGNAFSINGDGDYLVYRTFDKKTYAE